MSFCEFSGFGTPSAMACVCDARGTERTDFMTRRQNIAEGEDDDFPSFR